MLKKIMLLGLLAASMWCKAQSSQDGGKTYYYYDEQTKQRVKEIFHYIEVLRIKIDHRNFDETLDTTMRIKHGPYCMYYESGALMKSGYFIQDKPDSNWIYYDEAGKVVNRQLYRKGVLVQ